LPAKSIKGVGAAAEARRHPALGDGSAGDKDVTLDFLLGQQRFEGFELEFTVGDLIGEVIDHVEEVRRLVGLAQLRGFRATQRGRLAEIELAFIEIGNGGQTLAEGVQTHDTRLQFGDF